MFKIFEIDSEMKQFYKEQFNIDPDTASGCSLFTEEEQIERYSQNIAFCQKLKASGVAYHKYPVLNNLYQMQLKKVYG